MAHALHGLQLSIEIRLVRNVAEPPTTALVTAGHRVQELRQPFLAAALHAPARRLSGHDLGLDAHANIPRGQDHETHFRRRARTEKISHAPQKIEAWSWSSLRPARHHHDTHGSRPDGAIERIASGVLTAVAPRLGHLR